MSTYTFKSKIFILPGLGNSGDQHWQTLWENKFGFIRIEQQEWDTPVKDDWIDTIEKELSSHNGSDIILVGHSLAVSTIAFWAAKYKRKIKGALLVAPSDTEAPSYPPGTKGFAPMPTNKLPFPSVTITSTDDVYVTLNRAEVLASSWGSKLINIGKAGHINTSSGHGEWPDGLKYLKELDN